MKVTSYICDRCAADVAEKDLGVLSIVHRRGKFDLRDEEFHLCPTCDEAAVAWVKGGPETKEKRHA